MRKKHIILLSLLIVIIGTFLYAIVLAWPFLQKRKMDRMPISEEIIKELRIARKELDIGQTKWITLKNINEGDIFLWTDAYIATDDIEKVVKNRKLAETIANKTGLYERDHIFIIKGNQIKWHSGTGVRIPDGVLSTKSRKITFQVKKPGERWRLAVISLQ